MPSADASKFCEFLEWDSRLFGRRIARLKVNQLSAELMPGVERWCREQQIECLYLLADPDHPETAQLATEHHFQLVDIRVTLGLTLKVGTEAGVGASTGNIRPGRPEDAPALKQMAKRLHRDSRFFFDTRFDPELSQQMFEIWMEKACAEPAAGVLVADWEGNLSGYITCHRSAPDRGRVQLFGVDELVQGRGLGKELMVAARRWFATQKIEHIQVITQGRNCRAQRFYQRAGFATCSLELWYHRWFDPAEKKSAL